MWAHGNPFVLVRHRLPEQPDGPERVARQECHLRGQAEVRRLRSARAGGALLQDLYGYEALLDQFDEIRCEARFTCKPENRIAVHAQLLQTADDIVQTQIKEMGGNDPNEVVPPWR